MTCVILNRGTRGGYNRDKKHCCFHLELNYGLNTDLKQRKSVYGTIKGSILNFRIIFFFHSFSFIRFPPRPPVQYYTGQLCLAPIVTQATAIFLSCISVLFFLLRRSYPFVVKFDNTPQWPFCFEFQHLFLIKATCKDTL